MLINQPLNVVGTFNITRHSILRHQERSDKGSKYSKLSTVVRILELSLKDQKNSIENLEKFIYVYNKWKNKKKDFQHEGKCVLLYVDNEDDNKIYKISCGINISINDSGFFISFTFPTFMNVWNNALNYIYELKKIKEKAVKENMVISIETQNRKYNVYITPDK
jgi:hypothetical protein